MDIIPEHIISVALTYIHYHARQPPLMDSLIPSLHFKDHFKCSLSPQFVLLILKVEMLLYK
jgi:hypothetical protein